MLTSISAGRQECSGTRISNTSAIAIAYRHVLHGFSEPTPEAHIYESPEVSAGIHTWALPPARLPSLDVRLGFTDLICHAEYLGALWALSRVVEITR